MNRRTSPPRRAVYLVRWHRRGGNPAHRFYFLPWYAERFATALIDAGYDVELYASTATWTRITPTPTRKART